MTIGLDDRYVLGPVVGRGGMAEVHRATDRVLEREVAVKMLRSTTTDESARARFAAEARTVAALNHPGVVTLLDAGIHDEHPYLVMELVDGPTLGERLRTQGPLTASEARDLGAQLADALACAHDQGVIHRDVKPGNILLAARGRVVLTDFGIARLVADTSAHTQTGEVIGSPAYLSPEQVNGSGVTTAVDVYALGLVLLESLTNVRAYPGTPVEAALARLATPPSIPETVEPALADLLRRMTALDPADRPSAAAAATALRATGTSGTEDAATATAVLDLPPARRRSRLLPILAAAVLVGALAIAAATFSGSGPASSSAVPAPVAETPTSAPTPTATPTRRPTASPVTTRATATAKAAKAAPGGKKPPAKGKGHRRK
ncbi:MAG: serine/threonine-protein kinase [Propionibacteriales bacterium]|nr:serine/threonine-protein kinase [Propionibacteriales bacterium]